jgi:tetratricopeptide (TPR) repeat protein
MDRAHTGLSHFPRSHAAPWDCLGFAGEDLNMSNASLDELLDQAKALAEQRDFQGAARLYQAVIAQHPSSTPALDGLGTVYFVLQDYRQAVNCFLEVAALKPTDGKPLFNAGAIYNRMGEHAKAVDVIRKGLVRDKRCAEGYYNLGIAHRKQSQWQMAISAYREAIRLDPTFAEAFQNLGNVYLEMTNYPLAIQNFKKALEVKPGFAKAIAGLQKAEGLSQQMKNQISPFGRLVDQKAALQQNTSDSSGVMRQMTGIERQHDRQASRELARQIEAATHELLEYTRNEFLPLFNALHHLVAEGDTGLALHRASQQYRDAVNRLAEYRRLQRRKLLELQAHEELVQMQSVSVG